MKILWLLFKKDSRFTFWVLIPSALLGFAIILLMSFTRDTEGAVLDHHSKLWVAFFVAASSIFYRSFQGENQNRNFILFTQFSVPKIFIFLSQTIHQVVRLFFVGLAYLTILHFLFSFPVEGWTRWILILFQVSFCIAPLGALLGLGLQAEREFLFSLIFIPLITPVILAAHAMSLGDQTSLWSSLTLAFGVIAWFFSSLIFEFFFDDLTQTS